MSWHLVTIESSDVATTSATGLINKFVKAYHMAGVPTGVEVYHRVGTNGGHAYYFSPQAFQCAVSLLTQFQATACNGLPDLSKFRKVEI